jgi:aminomethyltransferase
MPDHVRPRMDSFARPGGSLGRPIIRQRPEADPASPRPHRARRAHGAVRRLPMPVQYPAGIMAEHNHTRHNAGLFDVSHMGQAFVRAADFATAAAAMEALVPADIASLAPGQQRYSQLLNDDGGIIDDLMIARSAHPGMDGGLYLVVNASRKQTDFAHLRQHLPEVCALEELPGSGPACLAGPTRRNGSRNNRCLAWLPSASCTDKLSPSTAPASMSHVQAIPAKTATRSRCPPASAEALWNALLAHEDVLPIGLGARDSLRLEAGSVAVRTRTC